MSAIFKKFEATTKNYCFRCNITAEDQNTIMVYRSLDLASSLLMFRHETSHGSDAQIRSSSVHVY
ncbi:MAG TPA: hypothetical protein DDW73_15045 [Rhizobium sp.]|nr:hypothetical protein [Rhizobium sp.]